VKEGASERSGAPARASEGTTSKSLQRRQSEVVMGARRIAARETALGSERAT